MVALREKTLILQRGLEIKINAKALHEGIKDFCNGCRDIFYSFENWIDLMFTECPKDNSSYISQLKFECLYKAFWMRLHGGFYL
jgi:hypothetical protein